MNKKGFLFGAISIWLVAVGSLLGVRYLVHKGPRPSGNMAEIRALYDGLDEAGKKSVQHFESGFLRLGGSLCLIGSGFERAENEGISQGSLSSRQIEFRIADPVLLERKLMVGEAFKTLNNAERKCYADGFGTIIFRNGGYAFYVDKHKYAEYVKKYGTECKSCDEQLKATESK